MLLILISGSINDIESLGFFLLVSYPIMVLKLLLCFVIHEFAHAATAYLLGDHTQKIQGRLTLNPKKHLDWKGALFLLVVGFGWAKPVRYLPENLKNPKIDSAITAFAGPAINFVFAFVLVLAGLLLYWLLPGNYTAILAFNFLAVFAALNVFVATFNMIPLHPLDGSKIVALFMPSELFNKTAKWQTLAFFLIIILLIFGPLASLLISIIDRVLMFMLDLAASLINILYSVVT